MTATRGKPGCGLGMGLSRFDCLGQVQRGAADSLLSVLLCRTALTFHPRAQCVCAGGKGGLHRDEPVLRHASPQQRQCGEVCSAAWAPHPGVRQLAGAGQRAAVRTSGTK